MNVLESISVAGNKEKSNEDYIGYGKDFIFVLDGASGLSGVNIMADSDAAWFATEFGSRLIGRIGLSSDPVSVFHKIVNELYEEYRLEAKRRGVPFPKDSPSAGMALFKICDDGMIRFIGYGDCVGVVKFKNGDIVVLSDDKLPVLDGSVIAKMYDIHKSEGIDVIDCCKLCNDMLLENRSKRNTDDGYGVLDLSFKCLEYARKEHFRVEDVEELYVFTDGFTQVVEVFDICKDYNELCNRINNEGLASLYLSLWEAQQLDSKCNKYPRFKLRDDASAVYARLGSFKG